ncbi:hypothetical protein F5Y06DRAFT_264134 [Hypoxylon sp. FL0890]|nr:hypothetical protein F5Y06DRAFT_264134 [Hypoxylon sp. FL0890]
MLFPVPAMSWSIRVPSLRGVRAWLLGATRTLRASARATMAYCGFYALCATQCRSVRVDGYAYHIMYRLDIDGL